MEVIERDRDDVYRIAHRPQRDRETYSNDDIETVVDVYLEPFEIEFLRANNLLIARDPTTEDSIMVGAPSNTTDPENGLKIPREGSVTATFLMNEGSANRLENGSTPLVYASAHEDGRGENTEGTIVRFFHIDYL